MYKQRIGKIAEVAKPHLENAKVVVTLQSGYIGMQWLNREGKQIADCQLGIPSGCTNNPFDRRATSRGSGHFIVNWSLIPQATEGIGQLDDYWELDANDTLSKWLNSTPFIAHESCFIGHHVTRGTWHAGNNRWIFGPKQSR